MREDILVLIPARGGSKGIPGKNIKPLLGKPLIYYSLDIARQFFAPEQILVSTDDVKIKETVEDYGIPVPFLRPEDISGDTASSNVVILHALDFLKTQGRTFKYTLLLQPTSPYRQAKHINELLAMIDSKESFEMILSVKETESNPYFVLYEEEGGLLQRSKKGNFTRRQDCPKVWEANGSLYLFDNEILAEKRDIYLLNKKKLVMDDPLLSIDLDTPTDWQIAELLLKDIIR
ncbi:acylneuraminate cytidylyltransferase family protein [Polluticaenibacter yanchengensis]|uniref:Acylneuraminate cytidylyltransferase family protein n=1 Tax=Polluticaenibacter yanchengensis TaxID=3014562 RepID=A0ABT4UHN8_9BACT|nr:acylneuraminate cytidylyltransferase family protein [Chitinophagaceae bacterium LY-5]